jgi:ABC-2 type transport system ATP-binding protein
VLLATHNAEEAFDLCDRVAILHRGQVLATGSARALARDVGDGRYHVWTRDVDHPVWRTLIDRRVVVSSTVIVDEGWSRVDLDIAGGMNAAASVLDLLQCAGVSIARYEKAPVTLADLIDRVVQRQEDRDA